MNTTPAAPTTAVLMSSRALTNPTSHSYSGSNRQPGQPPLNHSLRNNAPSATEREARRCTALGVLNGQQRKGRGGP
jgi:hypothetical protein